MHTRALLQLDRRQLISLAALRWLSSHSPGTTTSSHENRLYVGHSARVLAMMPADWKFDWTILPHYGGPSGFILSAPLRGSTLEEVCDAAAQILTKTSVDDTSVIEQSRLLSGSFQGYEAIGQVMRHPYPFTLFDEEYRFVLIATDPMHFNTVTSSISFEPGNLTPEAYLSSVIEMVQSMAWWSEEIEWDITSANLIASINGLSSIESVQGAVQELVATLRAVGDRHSFVMLPDYFQSFQAFTGFGMLVGGNRVLAVYASGPADRAGLRAGDIVDLCNGHPPPVVDGADPASLWPSPAELLVSREDPTGQSWRLARSRRGSGTSAKCAAIVQSG